MNVQYCISDWYTSYLTYFIDYVERRRKVCVYQYLQEGSFKSALLINGIGSLSLSGDHPINTKSLLIVKDAYKEILARLVPVKDPIIPRNTSKYQI